MKIEELLATAREAITVRRVYGEPYEKDGVTFIAAARLSGGGGGGGGQDKNGQEGQGGGFGVQARPAGAYVIKVGYVRGMPAAAFRPLLAPLSAVVTLFLITCGRI